MKKNTFSHTLSACALICAAIIFTLPLSGCSSTVARVTGSQPVGMSAGDRTLAQRLRDSGIESDAKVNLYKLDRRFEKYSHINIHAFHDVVLVTGQVPNAKLKKLATKSISQIREVKLVHNELTIAPRSSYSEIVNDGVIKARVRADLLLVPYLKDSRVKVAVEQGTVYLMGILSSKELQHVHDIVQKSVGVKRIISLIDVIENKADNHINTASTNNSQTVAKSAQKTQPIDPTRVPQYDSGAKDEPADSGHAKYKNPVQSGERLSKPQTKVITRELSPEAPD